MKAEKHLCIFLEGIVQGVGMRYYVHSLAGAMGLRGYVRNTSDGRVKCVARGDGIKLKAFIASLKNSPRGRVDRINVGQCPSEQEYTDFKILF